MSRSVMRSTSGRGARLIGAAIRRIGRPASIVLTRSERRITLSKSPTLSASAIWFLTRTISDFCFVDSFLTLGTVGRNGSSIFGISIRCFGGVGTDGSVVTLNISSHRPVDGSWVKCVPLFSPRRAYARLRAVAVGYNLVPARITNSASGIPFHSYPYIGFGLGTTSPSGASKYSIGASLFNSRSIARSLTRSGSVIVPAFSLSRRDSRFFAFSMSFSLGRNGFCSISRNAPGLSRTVILSPVAFLYSLTTCFSAVRITSYNFASVAIRFGLSGASFFSSMPANSPDSFSRFAINSDNPFDGLTGLIPSARNIFPRIICSSWKTGISRAASPTPIFATLWGVANLAYGVPGFDRNNDASTPGGPRI